MEHTTQLLPKKLLNKEMYNALIQSKHVSDFDATFNRKHSIEDSTQIVQRNGDRSIVHTFLMFY